MKPIKTTEAYQQGLAELRDLMNDETRNVNLHLTRWQAYCLIGQLQLALRHPGNTGVTRPVVEEIALSLEDLFSDRSALADLIKQGWRS